MKQDYRHLASIEEESLLVLPWTELKLNPLVPPPGVKPRRWAQVFSEIFGHATSLLSGSKNHLLKSIIELYRLYGLFEENSPPYPSLHELEQFLVSDSINYMRKTSNYRDTILNRVEAMNLGAGTIFDCSQGFDLEDLLSRNVVFEFDGLSRDTQNFLMETLLAWVYEYRLAQTHRSSGLNHVFALDEGKQVFSVYKERQDAAGIPAVDELTAKMREFGEGLIVADQEASKLTDSIKANTYTKVLLSTGDQKQFRAVADSMNLTERQADVAQDLDVGEAVIQTGNSNPAQIILERFELDKEVTDTELQRNQAKLWTELSSTPRQRPTDFQELTGSQARTDEIIDDPNQSVSLSAEAEQLLEDAVEYPFVPLTQRYDQLASRRIGHNAKTELIDKGVVKEELVQTGSGSRKLLELTERGNTYVEDQLECDPSHKGRGGIVHRYWQYQVKKAFGDADWTAKRELFGADVYASNGKTEVAIEIAMENTSREQEHVEKHLEKGFDAVWVFCRNPRVREGLETRIDEAGLDTEHVVLREVKDLEQNRGQIF
ncbi:MULTISPECIES: ATP-binding protein [Halorussus]|uniref:ATP-binding protein n=1 Tax=Halorussus TaxID=1070314 RepID=UPI0020A0AE0E|nr:ATP-binding protein [Halorussus vallis]USZ77576.1 ATP-binding protein [Halorussus vallis]